MIKIICILTIIILIIKLTTRYIFNKLSNTEFNFDDDWEREYSDKEE